MLHGEVDEHNPIETFGDLVPYPERAEWQKQKVRVESLER